MKRLSGAALPTAALAGLALLNKRLVDREEKPAETDGGRILHLAGGNLHVLEEGPPDAPPLVMLHGFAGSLRWFDRLAPLLASSHHVIRIDLLGHGGSSKPGSGYEMHNQARLGRLAPEPPRLHPPGRGGPPPGGAGGPALARQPPRLP